MKRIAIIFAVLMAAVSCQKPAEDPIVRLDVNYNNISGSWKLVTFDGNKLDGGVFQYINFERKAVSFQLREFQEYSNIDSQYPVRKIGRYELSETEDGSDLIRGLYPDELSREWNHSYVITDLTESTMTWTAEDDPAIVNVYERAEIPSEILDAFPVEE